MIKMIMSDGISLWGIIIPALIFIFSFIVTYLLYRHFSKEVDDASVSLSDIEKQGD